MIRIGYAPGAFDLFHIGHLNLFRRAKERCDYLVAGVVSDEVLIAHKGVTPVVPLVERIERELGYPCFVKPANMGSSVGVSKAHDHATAMCG